MDYKHEITIWTRDVGSVSDQVCVEVVTATPMDREDARGLLVRAVKYARREFHSTNYDAVARAIEKVCFGAKATVLQRESFSFEMGELSGNGVQA